MLLYIMRHGDALSQAKTDAERPLSDFGKSQAQTMVQCFAELPPTRLIASPYLRAQETAKIVKNGLVNLGTDLQLETVEFITPNKPAGAVIKKLEQFPSERLLMVSHQPLVGTLLTLLTEGHSMGYPVNTASVACLELDELGIGMATLRWLKAP